MTTFQPVGSASLINREANALIAQDGYWRDWHSGMIEQWGRASLTGGGGSTTITFPVEFPTQCFQVTATVLRSPNTTIMQEVNVETFDTATVLLHGNQVAAGVVTAPAMTVLWRAIGF
jgi:hypothetical protein